jgi:NRPS condensation-like uncharacterized protein
MFPLPLTPFEEYMFWEDCPAYPMTGVFRLQFSGFLERAPFEAALAVAVERHPLLRATVSRSGHRRPAWIDHPEWRPTIHWHAQTNPHGFPNAAHTDLTQGPGTRVWVVDRDAGHDAVFQVHHCCADALGMSKVLEDVLIGYAGNVSRDIAAPPLAPLDPRRLLRRSMPGVTLGRFLRMAHKQAVGLLGVREFLMRSPVPLVWPAAEIARTSPPAAFPAPRTHDFEPDETRAILAAAKSAGVTLNDLLVRDLFLAVGAWRRRHDIGDDRQWLRFSIPMGLRTPDDETMPMTNSVSMVFLDRRETDFSEPGQLLEGIHRQMQRIKNLQLQYTFVLSLAASRWLPGGLARETRADRCRSTSCLLNLGPVLEIGRAHV